jgi:hypothetical protein
MSRRPIAEVRVIRMPHLAEGYVRIEVACSGSVMGLTHAPGGPIELDVPLLTTFAAYEHEERCDAGCDTSRAHARGDRRAREYVERLKASIGARWSGATPRAGGTDGLDARTASAAGLPARRDRPRHGTRAHRGARDERRGTAGRADAGGRRARGCRRLSDRGRVILVIGGKRESLTELFGEATIREEL